MRLFLKLVGCLAGATLIWGLFSVRSPQNYAGLYKSSGYKFFKSLSIDSRGKYSREAGGGCDVYRDEHGNIKLPSTVEEGNILAFGDCLILCPTSEKSFGPPLPDLGKCSMLETAQSVGTVVWAGNLSIADGLAIITGVRVLRPVSWGTRQYLVSDMCLFSQAVNEDPEPRHPDDSDHINRSSYLRAGDENKPAPGRPRLPGLWRTAVARSTSI